MMNLSMLVVMTALYSLRTCQLIENIRSYLGAKNLFKGLIANLSQNSSVGYLGWHQISEICTNDPQFRNTPNRVIFFYYWSTYKVGNKNVYFNFFCYFYISFSICFLQGGQVMKNSSVVHKKYVKATRLRYA